MQRGPGSNVTLVESAIDAYNRRDIGRLCGLMSEDIDLRPPVSALSGRAYRGHDGIVQWLRDVDESFSTAQIEPLELRDLGARVVALTRFDVEGHGSRVPLGSELGLVLDIADGHLTSWLGFFNHAEALDAASRRTIS